MKFEDKVLLAFESSRIKLNEKLTLALAVSGGADSVSMLLALHKIKQSFSFDDLTLKVVTVNHNIREKNESAGDASYVELLCKRLGIFFRSFEIPQGEIFSENKILKCGIESCARKKRYEIFEKFIEEEKIDFLCLAHNADDFDETVLMRFFQGSSKLSGIQKEREHFFRPLLKIHRSEIEEYLLENKIEWRTDKTNFDNKMFRNKIRNKIIPFLDEELVGWRSGVEHLAEKNADDEDFLQCCTEKVFLNLVEKNVSGGGTCFSFSATSFEKEAAAIKRRLLLKIFFCLGLKERLAFSFVGEILKKNSLEEEFVIENKEVTLCKKNDKIQIQRKNHILKNDGSKKDFEGPFESEYFLLVKKSGKFTVGKWRLIVENADNKMKLCLFDGEKNESICLEKLKFPFVFRSPQSGDQVRQADGSFKNLSKVLSDFKAGDFRNKIPVLENITSCQNEIVLLWGSIFALKNWIL